MKTFILETERLRLEALDESYFEDLYSLLSNEVVHRYFPATLNRRDSEEFLREVQKRYSEDGYCFWAVIRKEDNAFLGICGLLKQIVEEHEETEVGYRILDKYWGQGYGTEAALGCMHYAKDVLHKSSVISLIREVNKPSIRVAEKNGLTPEKRTIFHGLEHLVYRKQFT